MSRLKDRQMYVIRRRGQNLFLDESQGDAGYSGFSEFTTMLNSEGEAMTKLESLPDHENLELVPVEIRFSKPVAWRALVRRAASASRALSSGSRPPLELAA